MKIISMTETSADKFDLVLQINGSVEKLQISIFESKGIWGIESGEFEKLLRASGSAKENQQLIAAVKQKYFVLKEHPELQIA